MCNNCVATVIQLQRRARQLALIKVSLDGENKAAEIHSNKEEKETDD